MNCAFLNTYDGMEWVGGYELLKSFIKCLTRDKKNNIKSYVFSKNLNPLLIQELNQLKDVPIIPIKKNNDILQKILYRIKKNVTRKDYVDLLLDEYKIDVLIGHQLCRKQKKILTIAWHHDFQHERYPNFFSARDRSKRRSDTGISAKLSDKIIVATNSVKKDFEKFMPEYINKVRVVTPVVDVSSFIYNQDPLSICRKYRINNKFIYCPSQLWRHKNHIVLLQAIKILKKQGLKIYLVCSGMNRDYRFPIYYSELLEKVTELGINDQVMFVGLVPRNDVLLLMRQSAFVVSASLFEGLGLPIGEAISLGKKIVASDIPAHREQNPINAVFFNPLYPKELAEKIADSWSNTQPGPDLELERIAQKELPDRLKNYSESMVSILRETKF